MLKLSLIIPVYNEERHIGACLDAIAIQSVAPSEVIIVDNNCTDNTLEIAEKYDFVKIIKESRQGRGFARTAGFNAASGDILGRIDADSLIKKNWVEKVLHNFESKDKVDGLTGLSITPILPLLRWPKSTLFSRAYYWNVHGFFGTITTWGATMAITNNAWQQVKDQVCLDDKIVHEDQDVALWMAGKSMKIIQANEVRCTAYNQSFRYLPKMMYYIHLGNKTKEFHEKNGNLPAPEIIRISKPLRIGSYIFSMPALIYGVFFGIIMLPIDWIMVNIIKYENWFD